MKMKMKRETDCEEIFRLSQNESDINYFRRVFVKVFIYQNGKTSKRNPLLSNFQSSVMSQIRP